MQEITEIKCDEQIEVTKKVYNILMSQFAGVVAGRIENNQYFIKVWVMNHKEAILKIINKK